MNEKSNAIATRHVCTQLKTQAHFQCDMLVQHFNNKGLKHVNQRNMYTIRTVHNKEHID